MNAKRLYKVLSLSLILLMTYVAGNCQQNTGTDKIKYTSFTVNEASKGIVIDWVTDTSFQVNYFEVQRSADGKDFKAVALVMGPDPRVASGDHYECIDKTGKKNKKYFYRLKHVAVDGGAELSETKTLALK
jgi:hypothetical protein